MGIENKLAYRHWLKTSFEWETIRMIAMIKAGDKCCVCYYRSPSNNVHHLFYRDKWDKTEQADVVVLCERCHRRTHEITKPSGIENEGQARCSQLEFRNAQRQIRVERNIPDLCTVCRVESAVTVVYIFHSRMIRGIPSCEDCFAYYLRVLEENEKFGKLFVYGRTKQQEDRKAYYRLLSSPPTQPPAAGRSDT